MNNNDRNDSDESEELAQMDKILSPRRGVVRIILGLIGLIVWILIGVSPNILFTSGIQGFTGIFSFITSNPVIFLLIAFLNIFSGAIAYVLVGLSWWSGFHFVWSIRWFYGYFKYHKIKNTIQN